MRRPMVFLLVVLALAQAYSAVQWSRYQLLYVSARGLDDAGRYADALVRMERAVLVRPHGAVGRAWVGDMALRFFDYPEGPRTPDEEKAILDRAWAGYAGAVMIAPLDSWSWSGLAQVAVRQARLKDRVFGVSLDVITARGRGVLDPWRAMALGSAQLSVSIKPSGYGELDVLAEVYESGGDVERAAATYVRSARLMPAPSFHAWGEGRVFTLPIYDRLLAGLVAGIDAAPDFDRSLFHLDVARFARQHGDVKTAMAQARLSEQAARNAYERYQAAKELALAIDRDDPEEALQAWRRAEQTGFDPGPVALSIGALELRLGDAREACAHFRTALRLQSRDASLRIQTSTACERAGEIDTADQVLRDGFVDPTEAMSIAEALVRFLQRNGRVLTARSLVNQWLRDQPDRPEFRRWSGQITDLQAAPDPGRPPANAHP